MLRTPLSTASRTATTAGRSCVLRTSASASLRCVCATAVRPKVTATPLPANQPLVIESHVNRTSTTAESMAWETSSDRSDACCPRLDVQHLGCQSHGRPSPDELLPSFRVST